MVSVELAPGFHPVILVLDDQPAAISLRRLSLSRAGFEVRGFTDVESFITYVDGGPVEPVCIIVDAMMGYVDGFEVIRKIRTLETTRRRVRRIPILMHTALDANVYRAEALEAGADGIISKTAASNEFRKYILEILAKSTSVPLS